MTNELTAERARELLDYNPETGEFRWKVTRGGRRAGTIAGHSQLSKRGERYVAIRISGHLVMGHRLVWLMTTGSWPDDFVSHKSRDRLDNRLSNLRELTGRQTKYGSRRRSDNHSGFKGVSWDRENSKWVARIRTPGGAYKNLGRFALPEAAHAAYAKAAKEMFGEFARVA
ncbi:HNH endonuclease [Burkholderia ambifaria]|jgi:hypothetical protein|uniref:HNH endonuclease n=1 Tax=Burkholderia ambifaria TaxID=152480 RepID=UPI00158E12C9|nr:HNH endonuclease [Burkholderia ambifaria]